MNHNWKQKFTAIYAGQAFSLLGSAAAQFAIIWWLTVETESAITLTLATIIAFLPSILIGPFAGVWIDRYNRRTVMIAADGLIALSSLALAAGFYVADVPPLWFIYGVLFVRGLGNTFHTPAMQAAIPMFVPAEMLTKAGGWGNMIVSASTMTGPALGAGLMSILPIAAIMLVDIAGAIIAIGFLFTVSIPDIPRSAEKVHILADAKQGFLAMRGNRPLMAAFFPIVLTSLLYQSVGALYPLLIRIHYAGEAWHNAMAEFTFSGGLLVSSLVMGLWGGKKKRFLMISAAIAVLGLAAAVGGALPNGGFWGFVVCCFLMGASGTFFNVPLMAYIQETTAPEMMGKVFSLLTTSMMLATPLGLILAGPVGEAAGVDNWFLWSGILMAATGAVCYFRTRRFDAGKG
jgi:DHA3 family macrolide efflux protein-like MFS transporter